MIPSPFFDTKNWVAENELAFVRTNKFPVASGHVLVIPKREAAISVFDMTHAEIRAVLTLAHAMKPELDALLAEENGYAPDGYTVGWNAGAAGGQSVGHAHLHIIPRYWGDAEQVRGGICRVVPEIAQEYDTVGDPYAYHTSGSAGVAFSPFGHLLVRGQGENLAREYFSLDVESAVSMVVEAQEMEKYARSIGGGADGYNIGWNVGEAAGQTNESGGMHIVYRYKGDVPEPRGGICKLVNKVPDYYKSGGGQAR